MLMSVIVFAIIIVTIIGLLFYYDVFGIQSTNQDATNFFTGAGDTIKQTFNKHT